MKVQNILEVDAVTDIRTKPTERECPRCESILVLNNNEQCYECHHCGYIDCGEDE